MSVALLLIAHGALGRDLVAAAEAIFGTCPAPIASLDVDSDLPGERLLAQAEGLAGRLEQGDGLLILTDLFGATPANLALGLARRLPRARVVAGVNLPMLVRALNYADLALDQVTEKALRGGRDGILLCGREGRQD